jgi:septum formation protein
MEIKKKIILASSSPRRQYLFRQMGFDFEILPSNIEENFDANLSPEENALSLSKAKAFDIAKHYQDGFIVGADTIVVLDGKIMGKPENDNNAISMLKKLSGREHIVYTAFTIVDRPSNTYVSEIEDTVVKFRKLDKEEIFKYVKSGSPADKAGAYGIQDDYGALFVERIEGCFYNVVGFPLTKFYIALKQFQTNFGK